MKLRNLLLIGLGIAVGMQISRRLREDDPNVVRGPQRPQSGGAAPTVRIVSAQAQRLADQATAKSLDVIRRARGAIRTRLVEDDDGAWN